MWIGKLARGAMAPGDLVRAEVGTVVFYEHTGDDRRFAVDMQSYATRSGAKLKLTKMLALRTANVKEQISLLRVEVLGTGKPCKKRGRQPTKP